MKTITVLASAFLGVAFCLAIVKLDNAMAIGPQFPAYAGEADFSFRAAWFFLFLVPGFLLLGAWVGFLFVRVRRQALHASLGGVVGTLVHFSLLVLLAKVVERLPDQTTVNRAVVLTFASWLLLTALGIYIGSRFLGSRSAKG